MSGDWAIEKAHEIVESWQRNMGPMAEPLRSAIYYALREARAEGELRRMKDDEKFFKAGVKEGLERAARLMEECNNPEHAEYIRERTGEERHDQS